MFEDLEEAFGIPKGSTKMTPARIRDVETAIVKKTTDIEAHVSSLEKIDIMGDHSLELKEKVARGKEYLRREAIEIYEMTRDAVNMLKAELMPGASASMWLAYSNLIRATNECHSKVENIYTKLDDELRLIEIPVEFQEQEDNTIVTDVDALMNVIQKAKAAKNNIDVADIIETVDINIDDDE